MKPFYYKTKDGKIVEKNDRKFTHNGVWHPGKGLIPVGERLTCEALGYKAGDLFETVVSTPQYNVGDKCKLLHDDNSDAPLFVSQDGSVNYFIPLEHVVPLAKEEPEILKKLRKALEIVGEKAKLPPFNSEGKPSSNPSELLSQVFNWTTSEKGFDYWEAVQRKLAQCENGRRNLVTTLELSGFPDADKALPEFINAKYDKDSSNLNAGFVWHETPQGRDYWRVRYDALVQYERLIDDLKSKINKAIGHAVEFPVFMLSMRQAVDLQDKKASKILNGSFVFADTKQRHAYWQAIYEELLQKEKADMPKKEPFKITMEGAYQTQDGRQVRILAVDRVHDLFPVVALVMEETGKEYINAYTADGFYYEGKCDCNKNLVPFKHSFELDQKVEVSDDGKTWEKAYFAGYDDITPTVFWGGRTSFTSNGTVFGWKFCRAA